MVTHRIRIYLFCFLITQGSIVRSDIESLNRYVDQAKEMAAIRNENQKNTTPNTSDPAEKLASFVKLNGNIQKAVQDPSLFDEVLDVIINYLKK